MSDVNTTGRALELGISVENTSSGGAVINYRPSADLLTPGSLSERLEWVRQSYQRFFEKVLEKESLIPAPPAELG